MQLDIDPSFVKEIRVLFGDKTTYTLYINEHMSTAHNAGYSPGLALPITREQMLNIIESVEEKV